MEQQPDSKLQTNIAEAQLNKLNLEVSSLKWQNSWIGRTAQFATVFTISATLVTILATLFGVWQGYSKFVADKQKDRDLRAKELTERTNNQYRSNLQQILQYPIDEKQTLPSVIFLLRDLRQVTENGYQGTDLQERQSEIGTLLKELIKSSQFDLKKERNVEFDTAAMTNCEYYLKTLIKNSPDNVVIIDRYAEVIGFLTKEERAFESVEAISEDQFQYNGPRQLDSFKFRQFTNLIWSYREHINLINKSIESYPEDAKKFNLKTALVNASCIFYSRTNNWNLAKYIFRVDDIKLKENLTLCGYNIKS